MRGGQPMMRGGGNDFTKSFSDFQKRAWGDGRGIAVPPNLGGERVIRKKSKPSVKKAKPAATANGDADAFPVRRALVFGLLAQPAFYLGAKSLSGGSGSGVGTFLGGKKVSREELVDSYYDGDAVNSPAVELELLELLDGRASPGAPVPDPGRDPTVMSLIAELEKRGGTQIAASAGNGRWVLPWVGGWDRIWTNTDDASYLGGPKLSSFRKGATDVSQVSGRMFVYGPGEGGVVVEYLNSYQADAKAPIKVLLTRPGQVTNLGDNVFQLDFEGALDEYEVFYDKAKGVDRLANCKKTLNADGSETGLLECSPMEGGAERGAPASTLLVRTSYLSERLWILRNAQDTSKVSIFTRTEMRSVMDRRGLVADGQLKPSDDESIRYGRLLFGETIQDYSGWDAKELEKKRQKDKLLGR